MAGVDQPRFVARVAGYIASSARAVDPLEAVSADYQREISRRARVREVRETREAWTAAEQIVEGAIAGFAEVADPRLRPAVRGLEKARRRLGHAVAQLEPLDDDE